MAKTANDVGRGKVNLPLMPKGVDHSLANCFALSLMTGEPTFDAERR